MIRMSETILTSLPDPIVDAVEDGYITKSIFNVTVGFELATGKMMIFPGAAKPLVHDPPIKIVPRIGFLKGVTWAYEECTWATKAIEYVGWNNEKLNTSNGLGWIHEFGRYHVQFQVRILPGHRSFETSISVKDKETTDNVRVEYQYETSNDVVSAFDEKVGELKHNLKPEFDDLPLLTLCENKESYTKLEIKSELSNVMRVGGELGVALVVDQEVRV